MNFTGKTALITGGASGIGKATVMEFARCGARVICADIDAAKGADLVKEAGNLAFEFVAIDLADPVSVRRCAAEVLDRYGRVDILVNAAGWNDIQPFLQNAPDYMDRVLAVNLGGLLHLTRHCCRRWSRPARARSSTFRAMPAASARAAKRLMRRRKAA